MACGPDPGPLGWVDARAAVVRCTSAGRDRMPPVLLDLPVPEAPTGLFARRMDPMALDDLGFQRDTVACALLLPVDDGDAERNKALLKARRDAAVAASELAGMCACEAADQLDGRALLSNCVDRPTRRKCDVEEQLPAMEQILAPVYTALSETNAPMLHWRLVGKFDRAGWFARQQTTLIERHEGGSTVFEKGEAVPKRGNGPLIKALLDEDEVVAVVRQNSRQALLVVREIDKTLVLDHFAYFGVGDTLTPLLPYLDNASIARYRTLLAKPSETRKLRLEPGKGNMVEVDLSQLESIDGALRRGADLYDADVGTARELPARRMEYVAVQAPFGKQGQRLDARVELTPEGTEWASLLTSADLMPGLDELGLEPVELPELDSPLPFPLAGSSVETSVVYGLEGVPALMDAVESRYPGAVKGTAKAWSFEMPLSNLEGLVAPGARFTGLRTSFAERVFEVEVEVVEEGRALQVTVAPK